MNEPEQNGGHWERIGSDPKLNEGISENVPDHFVGLFVFDAQGDLISGPPGTEIVPDDSTGPTPETPVH